MKRLLLPALLLCSLISSANTGWWQGLLHRPDGINIPIRFEWKKEKSKTAWYIHNAEEVIRVVDVVQEGDSLFIEMPVFESQFRVAVQRNTVTGVWIKQGATKTQVMPFSAAPMKQSLQHPGKHTTLAKLSGRWAVEFESEKKGALSVGEFVQKAGKLTGTFLNATGDYRYLEGKVTGDSFQLAAFDGSHAYLFKGTVDQNKKITNGVFYAGLTYRETWTAERNDTVTISQDAVAMHLKPGEEQLHFAFKDLNGQLVSIADERFKNKVVIVQLMGSWCPNCMDEMAFLSDYYNHNRQRGIEVVALAYEYSTNLERSNKSLRRFQKQFSVQYPILNTGVTVGDSLRTEKTLPELTPIKFFPSSVILDKKGRVRKLDTGFNGPGTGIHFIQYKKEFDSTINDLLSE